MHSEVSHFPGPSRKEKREGVAGSPQGWPESRKGVVGQMWAWGAKSCQKAGLREEAGCQSRDAISLLCPTNPRTCVCLRCVDD